MKYPNLVALCGFPGAGKSTAAQILVEKHGYTLVDDGLPLRQIGMKYFGLTEHQVFTQEGKLEQVELNGRIWTVREILGEIGNAFEEKFGGDIIPIMSHNLMQPDTRYVMASVRRLQPLYWERHGVKVIEISRAGLRPSAYEFDRFERTPNTQVISNPENNLLRLEFNLLQALARYAG